TLEAGSSTEIVWRQPFSEIVLILMSLVSPNMGTVLIIDGVRSVQNLQKLGRLAEQAQDPLPAVGERPFLGNSGEHFLQPLEDQRASRPTFQRRIGARDRADRFNFQ